MYCVRKVTDDLTWIGGNDRQHPLFESTHPVPRGMSFNSYLLLDEKTVLFDTVDRAVQTQFFENLEHALNGTCRELSAQVEGEGLTLTGRFSPGYWDLRRTLQPALLERLQAYRIDLTVNAGGQLQPEKSVTALCGLRSGEEEQP